MNDDSGFRQAWSQAVEQAKTEWTADTAKQSAKIQSLCNASRHNDRLEQAVAAVNPARIATQLKQPDERVQRLLLQTIASFTIEESSSSLSAKDKQSQTLWTNALNSEKQLNPANYAAALAKLPDLSTVAQPDERARVILGTAAVLVNGQSTSQTIQIRQRGIVKELISAIAVLASTPSATTTGPTTTPSPTVVIPRIKRW